MATGSGSTNTNLNLNVAPPDKMEFSKPDNWNNWKKRFERYMVVSGLSGRSDNEQINTLLYIMGEESEEIMLQFSSIPTKYTEMIQEFENYFVPKKNVIFERFKFNSRIQKPGESIDNFIKSLHTLAENCEYGNLKEELIRDRIVVGMLDNKTSEVIQLKGKLSLSETITIVRRAENQAKQNEVLRQENQVYYVQKYERQNQYLQKQKGKVDNKNVICSFCARGTHKREQCPASGVKCHICSKIGHFAKACRSKISFERKNKVNFMSNDKEEDEEDDGIAMLGSVHLVNNINRTSRYNIELACNELDKTIKFIIDTGADITCIPSHQFPEKIKSKLKRVKDVISGPDGNSLNVVGKIDLTFIFKKIRSKLNDVYVINGLKAALLGRPGIEALKLFNCNKCDSSIMVGQISTSLDKNDIEKEFPGIFKSVGNFQEEICLQIKQESEPFLQAVPRVVSIPLLKPLKKEITRLLDLGIILPVKEHTEWVAPIVVVPKSDGSVRICGDYTKLNKNILRPHFPIPKVESTLAQLSGSRVFTKLDAASGFYQIKLKKESQSLTTFITPFGRYMFTRLPFGVSSASEYFSQKFSQIIGDIEGIVVHIDDILVHAPTLEKHNKILKEVIRRLHNEGITLNKEKCIIGVDSIKYLGHIISDKGIEVDKERVKAITEFQDPTNKTELMRLLGMINFASRFIPNKSEILQPLTLLTHKDVQFIWDTPQRLAMEKVKSLLINAPNLTLYDPTKKIIVSADASSYGLGATLFQINENDERDIVAYASRQLTETEKRYAQIEKEALALTWACDKFKEYVNGVTIILETDHKPLLQIFQTKYFDDLSPRLQRLRLRLMRYNYSVLYIPGKELIIPDTLSRSPIKIDHDNEELQEEVEVYVRNIIKSFPVKDYYLQKIQLEQSKDPICVKLKEYCLMGWPSERSKIPVEILPYYQFKNDISFADYLLKDSRLIIPPSLQTEVMKFIHTGHQGIVKCRALAKMSVWWIGLSKQIEIVVRNCPDCVENRTNIRETFYQDEIMERAWQKIALDLFKCNGTWYIVITDYFSRFFEIIMLKNDFSTKKIIEVMLPLFAKYGIPEIVRSDGGPQFRSEFQMFAKNYNFLHITSSPHFPQSNGAVEAAVKIAKSLIKKNKTYEELQMALLAYRSTPLSNGFSPAELLYNRKIRTPLPLLPKKLNETIDTTKITKKEEEIKRKQRNNYNSRHGSKDLSNLNTDDAVWITDIRKYGNIIKKLDEPRSYLVRTNNGIYRRNRWFLIPAPYHIKESRHEFKAVLPDQYTNNLDNNIEEVNNESLMKELSNEQTDKDDKREKMNNDENVGMKETNVSMNENVENSQCNVRETASPRRSNRLRNKPVWSKDYVYN